MRSRLFRRTARQLATRRRRLRAVAVVVLTALAVLFVGQPMSAMGASLPPLSLPRLSGLVDWLTAGPPQWGKLPHQASGTAAGRSDRASAASTRAKGGAGHAPKPGRGELPAYAPYARKVVSGPSASRLGFNARTSKRVAAKSTATSNYFQNADGSYTRQLFQGAVNYRDSSGNWQAIDTRVQQGGDKRWHEKANGIGADFAPSAADPSLARFSVDPSHSVGWSLTGAAPVAPVVSGATATYRSALPDTDLVLETSTTGVKESLLLKSAAAADSWTFPLALEGMTPALTADGSIDLRDAAGKTRAVIPPAYAYDSRIDPVSGEPATTHAVHYRLATEGGRTVLEVTLDRAWLDAPGRVFPVTVDPSTFNAQALTTYAESTNPGDHSMEQTIKVGSYDSGTHDAVSYLKFPNLGLDNSRITVSAASLSLFDLWSSTCTAERFDVAAVTKAWTPSGITAYPGPTYGASIGNLTPSTPNGCANTTGIMSKGDNIKVTLAPATFNTWAAATGATNDYGLAIYAATTDALHWKQFGSIYNLYGAPSLSLTYTGALLPQVVATSPANNAGVGTLTPQLTAIGQTDPNLTTTPKYDFQVFDTTGAKLADSGLITANYYNVPAGKLKWGQTYEWEAQSYDGTNYSPGPDWQALTTQVPQPVVTSGLSQNTDGHGYSPAIGNYTTSATDANVSTPGPSLNVERDYNSRDPRTTGAFGEGWSSTFDSRAAEQYDASGAVQSVQVTYPDGSAVGYGKNSDGSFSPPQGRFATFKSVTGGYTLTDKNATVYSFTQLLSTGVYGISSITDANGRQLTFTWTGGQITTMKSLVSNRSLYLTWSTPAGATSAHVATVYTDPVTAGNPSTALTWTYTYTGDELSKMCSPTDTTSCTQYSYTAGSQYPNQVLDQGPSSFWPLSEAAGATTAASAVLAREGADNGTYSNVTLGQPGPLAGGSTTAASFNGTSSSVQLPNLGLGTSSSQSISLWFKTSTKAAQVLFSYSDMPINATATLGDFTPSLYMGTDGELKGLFWYGETTTPITTTKSEADGAWHHVVLTGSWTAQTMYLDGTKIGTAPGYGSFGFSGTMPWLFDQVYLGTGYLGSTWPDQPHLNSATAYASYFNGSMADVSFSNKPLAQADVTALHQAGTTPAGLLSQVTRPSGKIYSKVSYDPKTTAVSHLTDEVGGNWTMAAPTVTGSSQVYRSAVMGAGPAAYLRLGDSTGAATAADEVKADPAAYSAVTLGAAGPFADQKAASFNGTSSQLAIPPSVYAGATSGSAELWFSTTRTTGGILLGATSTPLLWVGTDSKLHGGFWTSAGSPQIASTTNVTDGKWHHVLLTATATSQSLYLDGVLVKTTALAGALQVRTGLAVGVGTTGTGWNGLPSSTTVYFTGSIAEAAFYRTALTGQDDAAHYAAGLNSGGLSPLETVKVTDPGNHTVTDQYDVLNGYRLVADTDAAGSRTSYGYDTGGFVHTVTDADGDVDTSGHDVRGNTVSQTSCQNQAAQLCSTSYTTFLPDDTTAQLTPNPTNDLVATSRDGRSASATDNTYLTSYSYDAAGNRTKVITPPVPGFPAGRTTAVSYTDGSTIAAADGGFAPKGLPYKTVSPGGATTLVQYFKDGDVASMTDPDGLVTRFTYDNLGRALTKTEVSDTYPAGLTTTYVNDGESQVVGETDPPTTDQVNGTVHQASTTTVFDADGQVTSQTVADLTGGDAPRTTTSTYNAYDQLQTSVDSADPTAVTSYTYDAFGNQATVQDPNGTTTAYAYDPDGRLFTQTLKNYTADPVNPSAPVDLVESSRSYDPAGRLQSLTDAMGNSTAYTYTDNGLTATVTRIDGQNTANRFVEQADTYDAAGNLVKQVTNNGATVTDDTLDAADRVTATTVDPTGVDRTTTVSYTPDDRVATSTLSDATGATHTTRSTYDPMGNVSSRSIQEDGSGHPVGWWPLNQTAGSNVTDASGTGNTATATGVTWGNGAATFAGSTGQQIATNGPVLNTASPYSVSAWVDLSSLPTHNAAVVAQSGTENSGFVLAYHYQASGPVWSLWNTNPTSTSPAQVFASSATAAVANTWTHLVGTYDPSTGAMQLYVNGALAATGSNTSSWSATGPLTIGSDQWLGAATDLLPGSVANVQAYPRVLSAADIGTLFGGGHSGGTTASSTQATTSWDLDQRGLPRSMTDADQQLTGYTFDEAGHLVATSEPAVTTTAPDGGTATVHPLTQTGYDTFGDAVETKDADGNTVTTAYDADGRKTSVTLPAYTRPDTGATITGAGTSWSYDKAGNVTAVTDALNHSTSYLYDQLGDTAQVTDADNGVSHSVYDKNGEVTSSTDPDGVQSQAVYDYLGRQTSSTILERFPSASTSTTTLDYTASAADPGGAFLARTTSQDGVSTSFGYDNLGEQTQSTDPSGQVTTTQYNLEGLPVDTRLPDGTASRTSYDQLGDPVSMTQTDTDGTTRLIGQSAGYDAMGRLMSSTDANQHTTTYTRDALGQVSSETQPVDAGHSITTSFGYDADGNKTLFQDGRGNDWHYTTNSWNLPESTVEPAGTSSSYSYTSAADSTQTVSYDAAGRAVTQNAPGGVTATVGYDNLGNVTSQSGTGADAPTATRSFSYDHDGRMLTAATAATANAPATSSTFSYNDRGALLSATGSGGSSSFSYNADGLPTSITDASGTTGFGYDSADRLSTLSDPATGTQLSYGYNQLNQVSSIGYGTGGDTRSFGYDHLHRLSSDTLSTAGGATVASIDYGYDPNGNETSKNTTGLAGTGTNTYSYDWADRLQSWNNGTSTTQYSYDDSGNRTQVGSNVYTYDARDQLTSDGVNTYSYTARGTLSLEVGSSGSVASTSDAYNQQASQGNQSYVDDALGRLISESGTAGSPSNTFSYSGAGNTLASDGTYTYTHTTGGALVATGTPGGSTADATLDYTDQHDDVVGSFSPGGSTLTGSTAYDPLGNTTAGTGVLQGHLGYQSGWTDSATGKVDMAARWYNPATGQFMNKDTMSLNPTPNSAAANPFAYVDDNPLTRTDPSGHGFFGDVWNGIKKGASWVGGEIESGAKYVAKKAVEAYDWTSSKVSEGIKLAERAAQSVERAFDAQMAALDREIAQLNQEINDAERTIRRNAAKAWSATVSAASHPLRSLKVAATTTYHAVAKAVNTSANFVKNHAAAIASFAASTVVFMGCEAFVTAGSAGTLSIPGAIACGALAGEVGGAVNQGVECASGKGSCSVSAFAGSVVLGGIGGGIGGGIAGPLGGKLADSFLGGVLPKIVTNTLEGAAIGGLSGGATGAADYGLTCEGSSGGCSWSGLGSAVASGAESGAVGGAAGGAAFTLAGPALGKLLGPGCTAHSFTGATPVLMADGSTKAIDRIKVGDKIRDSVPGKKGTEVHTVTKVIVTTTDHDFVDVTITPTTPGAPASAAKVKPTQTTPTRVTPTRATLPLRTRVIRKAGLGLAASAAGLTALLGLGHHQAPAPTAQPLPATAPVASVTPLAPVTPAAASTLTTTFHHPFYDETQNSFVDAQYLHTGDVLQTPTGTAEVSTVRLYHADTTTYDLTIGDLHTYYVEAGTTPVLVHNCNLALGWRTKGTGEWAEKQGFTHMLNNPDDGWKAPTERQIGDPNVTLHVNLHGWDDFSGAVRSGLTGGGKATDLEMSWIARAVSNGQRSWDSVNFYNMGAKGDIVPVPRPDEPDWSSFGKLDPVKSTFTMCGCEGSVPWDE
ncbi:LamG-like jellyroll fold domain-containing protein [Streptacidiphilus sp. N1-3]|uniref:LamG-like jellyroll fold domain-containing protein n=1 Tax=Streptacidiphilus alkalitolerans TaxID=3342712 RepID=A0ABV6X8B8_9ACTN